MFIKCLHLDLYSVRLQAHGQRHLDLALAFRARSAALRCRQIWIASAEAAFSSSMFVMHQVPIPSCMHGSKLSQHRMSALLSSQQTPLPLLCSASAVIPQPGPCISWLSSAQTGLTEASHSLCCSGVSTLHDIIPCCRWRFSGAVGCLGVAVVGLVECGHALWLLGLLAHTAGGQHGRGGDERHASQRANRGSGDGARAQVVAAGSSACCAVSDAS